MVKKLILLVSALFIITVFAQSQNEQTPAASRFANIKKLLDYRYKGGFYTFEKDFLKQATYPKMAQQNCIIGILIASFKVDCDGNYNPIYTHIKSPLHFGLDDEVSKFLASTKGKWNKCHEKKYTRFEIPFQFTMEGTVTNEEDAAIVFEGKNPGYACTSDSVYLQRAKKYLGKKKPKKAARALEILIRRNPYTTKYYDMMKSALKINRKKKKKK